MGNERPKVTTILEGYRGSIAHGLHLDPAVNEEFGTDDIDIMSIFIPPIEYYFGLSSIEGWEYVDGKDDYCCYNIQKFFRLCANANPNVMFFLWNSEDMFMTISPIGRKILDNKEIFSSQMIRKSFMGYADSQLKHMFNKQYNGYMGTKRKTLVDKYGYDTKHAAHLIRILQCGIEFLRDGKLKTFREQDRDFLLDIKVGKFIAKNVEEIANGMFAELKGMTSDLPTQPQMIIIQDLLVDCIQEFYDENDMYEENTK